MVDFIVYDDPEIQLTIPSDLKSKACSPIWAFTRKKRDWERPGIVSLHITLVTTSLHRDALKGSYFPAENAVGDSEFEWAGTIIRMQVLRVGSRKGGKKGGLESLITETDTILATNAVLVLQFYNALVNENGCDVLMQFRGRGPIDDFDTLCNNVVESFQLKNSPQQ